MRDRRKIFLAITFVIVGLMISISGTAMFQNSIDEEKTLVFERHEETDFKVEITKAKFPAKINPSDTIQSMDIAAFDGMTPAVSTSGSTMAAASYSWDQENVYYYFSLDYGETWDGGLGWQVGDPPELPSVDGCGNGRYIASFVPSPYLDDGSATFKTIFDANDFENTFDGMYWTWNDVGDGYVYFTDVEVAGYTSSDPNENTWAYGSHSMIGDDLGNQNSQTPLFSYQCTEDGTAWIYTMGDFTGSESCGVDIDQGTNVCYSIYNYNTYNNVPGDMNLYIFIMDFNTWDEYSGYPIHSDTSEAYLNTSGNDNIVDISALNDNVIIVSERDGAIIAYYSDDGLNNINEVQIDSSGEEPRIAHTGDESAFCSYIKGGVLYTSVTEDGGATWTNPNENSEEGPVVSGDICAFGAMYEAEEIIYFAPIQASFPILEIDSISGGIGINAIVKNVGTAAAENVDWSIVTEGIVFFGGEKSGQITLQPGETQTIETGLMLGFGNIDVTVTLGTATKTASGKLLLFFITGLE